jgi:hypothetical protein
MIDTMVDTLGDAVSFRGSRVAKGDVMEVVWVIGVFVAYVVLMRWVLPRFGVRT